MSDNTKQAPQDPQRQADSQVTRTEDANPNTPSKPGPGAEKDATEGDGAQRKSD